MNRRKEDIFCFNNLVDHCIKKKEIQGQYQVQITIKKLKETKAKKSENVYREKLGVGV